APSAYRLEASMIGYKGYRSGVFELKAEPGRKRMGRITLFQNATELTGVEVVAKKPFFEQKIDRLVVNVAGSITAAGATALEVLERSPGVVVDRQNNSISLAGKDGVVVMINGKISRMPMSAVVQMLQGLPSGNIEKIELITTPPANFEAEGNAGYINIVLKQSTDQGLNGSYAFSGGFGKGDVSSAALNFNLRSHDINLYGGYSFSRQAQQQIFNVDRLVDLDGQSIRTQTETVRDPVQRNHDLRLGLDWNLSQKTVVGVLFSGYDNRWSMNAMNHSTLSVNGTPDTLIAIRNDEINHWKHFGGNLNLQHTIGEGESISLDFDYLQYEDKNPTNYQIDYQDAAEHFLFSEQTFSGKVTPIRIGVGKLDYTKQFSDNIAMQAGLKGTVTRLDNDVSVADVQNGIRSYNPDLTARYHLDESIAAAYASFDVKLDKKSGLKLGLRYEYTNSNLGSAEQADIVDRQYGNFFPSVFLSRNFNDNNSANISYSRRITRPTFKDMAPFVIFLDPYTFFSGNAALQPSISNNLKVDYRYKTALFSVQYAVEDSAIANFQTRVIEGTNQQLLAARNMKNRKTANFTVAFPLHIAKWWNMQNNLIGTWQEVNTFFDNDPIRVRTQNLQVVWINSFSLPRNFSAELVGFYRSKGLSGSQVSLPMGSVNIGIQKKLGGNAGTLRFGVDDLFNSLKFGFETNFPEYNLVSKGTADFSQRTFKLTYSRDFGNRKLKGNRKRATGAEDERKRMD
ncbi:MAG TPA: outer membrane beta-barrel family protein, partial [Flavilitoribacter sp.]|nr:outer membrane beta-barrel family protein [Flavilitoribacter sp.]